MRIIKPNAGIIADLIQNKLPVIFDDIEVADYDH